MFLFQAAMNPGRECSLCGAVFADRYKLYRHTINVHNRRFCWFWDHEEGRPRRLRCHVERQHPGVQVEQMANDELWRSIDDAIVQAPAAMIVVDTHMQLAPVTDVVVAVADVVVAVEERAPQEVAAEEVMPEEVAQEEMVPVEVEADDALAVTETVVEEVDGAESSGSWRQVEEVDVFERPASDEGAASPVVEIGCTRVTSLAEYRSCQPEVVWQ